ncbi:MAG: methionyl-tRNA formyltransferase [Bacteroidetes bacterium HGW-Bacteroidetes-2]|nr:MAG: methionyl-tRNA formyltransferase [Bacteroidetes bacterium HGW-Bacteroidetes-2]
MNDLRIVFLGTPDFAVATLKALVEHKKNIVGVITAPDKPAGRGRTLHQSAVKQYALSQNLKVLQPTNLKAEDFLVQLKALQANLQIVVAFRMLPKEVWQMPKFGTFNLHASLLPQYRGAAPINETTIEKNENASSLHDKLMHQGSVLVLKTISQIEEGTVNTKPQNFSDKIKTAYKLDSDNTKINWNTSVETIYNKVRGLSPYPSAWCYLQNGETEVTVKIFTTNIEIEKHNEEIGKVISTKKHLKVAAKNGYVFLQELQLPGKKKMDVKSLLNGYIFELNAKMR